MQCFSVRTSYKDLIWCTNNSNVYMKIYNPINILNLNPSVYLLHSKCRLTWIYSKLNSKETILTSTFFVNLMYSGVFIVTFVVLSHPRPYLEFKCLNFGTIRFLNFSGNRIPRQLPKNVVQANTRLCVNLK